MLRECMHGGGDAPAIYSGLYDLDLKVAMNISQGLHRADVDFPESGAGTEMEKLRHFRAFWAGGAPFIGEVGARGWAASLTAPGKSPPLSWRPFLPG